MSKSERGVTDADDWADDPYREMAGRVSRKRVGKR
jgi:hypothetical protein